MATKTQARSKTVTVSRDNLDLLVQLAERVLRVVPELRQDYPDVFCREQSEAPLVMLEGDAEFALERVRKELEGPPTPEVGMGATTGYGSDRYPYTVIEIISRRKIKLQADRYRRTDSNGMSEVQEYEITPNPEGPTETATLRKDGTWVRDGDPLKHGQRFWLGHRSAHFDPHF